MSYYQYMVSVYRSCQPQLNRSLRSSSVERSSTYRYATSARQHSTTPSRFTRAATVGPTDFKYNYVSAMPFSYQHEQAVQRVLDRNARASSVGRTYSYPSTYARAYASDLGSGYSAFDYKVMDYANRLDREEATREYINTRKYDLLNSRCSTSGLRGSSCCCSEDLMSVAPFRSRYDYYNPLKYERDYLYDTSDIGGRYRHYRMSNQTLASRNARARSPVQSRELDRYYKTERRTSFIGDVSSGANRDFRHYHYRPVPYFGGSDHFAYVNRLVRVLKREVDF